MTQLYICSLNFKDMSSEYKILKALDNIHPIRNHCPQKLI